MRILFFVSLFSVFSLLSCTDCPDCNCYEDDPAKACPEIPCDDGYQCVDGVCETVSNPCADVVCEDGLTCVEGSCVETSTDPCVDVECGDGFECVDGSCVGVEADPCVDVECGDGFECVDGECLAEGPCGGIKFEGCCDDNVLTWCTGDEIMTQDCSAEGGVCGWEAFIGSYHCHGEGEDPSATFPIDCP